MPNVSEMTPVGTENHIYLFFSSNADHFHLLVLVDNGGGVEAGLPSKSQQSHSFLHISLSHDCESVYNDVLAHCQQFS